MDIDLRLPLGDAGEAEPAPGIPQGALQRFPHLPGGAGGVEGREGGIGNQQFLRIVEAAQAGGAVRCAGDDGHEGIIGAVGVADYIVEITDGINLTQPVLWKIETKGRDREDLPDYKFKAEITFRRSTIMSLAKILSYVLFMQLSVFPRTGMIA